MCPSVRTVQCLTVSRMTLALLTHNNIAAHDTDRLSRVQQGISLPCHLFDASPYHKLACSGPSQVLPIRIRFVDPPLALEKKVMLEGLLRGPSPSFSKKKGGGEAQTQPFSFRFDSCIRRALVLLPMGLLFSPARALLHLIQTKKKR